MAEALVIESEMRNKYGINIDLLYREFSYARGTTRKPHEKVYANKIEYARNYITKIRKMYLSEADPEFEPLPMQSLINSINGLDRKRQQGIIKKEEKGLKERMHRTLVAKRLINEAIGFVGVEPFEKIIRRPVSGGTKKKHKVNEAERHKDTKENGGKADKIPGPGETVVGEAVRDEESQREGNPVEGGYILAL